MTEPAPPPPSPPHPTPVSAAPPVPSARPRLPRAAWAAAFAAGVIVLVSSLTLFRYGTLNNDMPAYRFGAQTLALGRTWVPAPAPRAWFDAWMVVMKDGRMYSRYPPGTPAVLLLGRTLFGTERLIPPLLVFFTVLLFAALLRRAWGEGPAVAGAWLLATSPFFLFTGSSLLSHGSCLLFLTAGTYGFIRMSEASRPGWGALAGASMGMAFLCRPLTSAAFVLGFVVYELATVRGRRIGALSRRWLPPIATGLLFVGANLAYNQATTGDAFRLPFLEYWPRDRWGFHKDLGRDDPHYGDEHATHSPRRGYRNTVFMWKRLDRRLLLLFPFGATLTLGLGLVFARKLGAYGFLFAGEALGVVLAYGGYYSAGMMNGGPVYYYELTIPLLALAAPGVAWLVGWWRRRRLALRWTLALVVLGVGVANSVAVYARDVRIQWGVTQYRRLFVEALEEAKRPALVFLPKRARYIGHPLGHLTNPPDFDAPILYAVKPQGARLSEHLPAPLRGRTVYEFEVVEGWGRRDPDELPAVFLRRRETVPYPHLDTF